MFTHAELSNAGKSELCPIWLESHLRRAVLPKYLQSSLTGRPHRCERELEGHRGNYLGT